MLLAELEIRHSRPIAPTRRVALGDTLYLPTDPAPGSGGILLAAIVATFGQELDEELSDELHDLLDDLELGRRIRQPTLRHRFQTDVVGLDRSHHRLLVEGDRHLLELEDKGHPVPQVLGAAYAAGMLGSTAKPLVFRLLRKAMLWAGAPGPKLVAYLRGDEAAYKTWTTSDNDERWALDVLGFDVLSFDVLSFGVMGVDDAGLPAPDLVQRRYRDLVRLAHPDVGGDIDHAGRRITELTEARRILLALG